jgi:hypothetical protein
MDVGRRLGLRSDDAHFRRSVCRATVDANPLWLNQANIQDLMWPRRDDQTWIASAALDEI